jgi:hypothetical protein
MVRPSPQERKRIEAGKAAKQKRRDDAAAHEAVIPIILRAGRPHRHEHVKRRCEDYTPNGRMEKN